MPYDETLAAKVRQLLGRRKNLTKQLTEKKMFGGVGFLLNGNICCGAWKEFLILRLGDDAARLVLAEEHARPFDITGKPMRGWAMVEPAGWRDAARLRRWVDWAVEFTSDLPAK
jgi:TfoX/Sxy family transcriptional regulator of competence genes